MAIQHKTHSADLALSPGSQCINEIGEPGDEANADLIGNILCMVTCGYHKACCFDSNKLATLTTVALCTHSDCVLHVVLYKHTYICTQAWSCINWVMIFICCCHLWVCNSVLQLDYVTSSWHIEMASQNMNREYDVSFVNPPPPEVQTECPICHCVLYRPRMATCPCGHSYCASCIGRVERDGKPCPLCGQPFALVDDNRLERILNGYDVHCPHKEKGCEWTGELGQLESHLNRNPLPDKQLKGCKFQEIQCGLCQLYYCERQLISNHVVDECQNRDIECEYHLVGCDFKKPQPELEEHMKDCMSLHLFLVSNHMQNNFSLKEKEVHELKDELKRSKDAVQEAKQALDGLNEVLLTQRKVTTSIVAIGIIFAILFSVLAFSNKYHVQSLMLKMEETLSTRQETNGHEVNILLDLKKQYESCRLQVESLRKEIKETQEQSNKIKIDVKAQHKGYGLQVKTLKEKVEKTISTQEQVSSIEIDLLDLKEQHENCRLHVQSLRQEVDKALSTQKLNRQQDELVKTNCTCLSFSESEFKVIKQEVEYLREQTDYPPLPVHMYFSELKKDESGDCLLSMPFYACASISCSYGYLMRLVVYPRGTNSDIITSMSVYIHLMKGRYDSTIDWPFRGVLKVSLRRNRWDPSVSHETFNFSDADDIGTRVINGSMAVKGLGDSFFFIPPWWDKASMYFSIENLGPVITTYDLMAIICDILTNVGTLIIMLTIGCICNKYLFKF